MSPISSRIHSGGARVKEDNKAIPCLCKPIITRLHLFVNCYCIMIIITPTVKCRYEN